MTTITAHPTLYCFRVIALSVPGGAPPTANLGPLKGGPLSLQGVRLPSLAWRSAGAHLRLSKNVRALFFLGRTWGVPDNGTEGDVGEAHRTAFTARFRHPDDYRPRKRYVWGTRQSRWPPPTALLSLSNLLLQHVQYPGAEHNHSQHNECGDKIPSQLAT